MSETDPSTKSATPTIVILGVVALSVILFFAFTLPYFKNRNAGTVGSPSQDPAPGTPAQAGAQTPAGGGTAPAAAPASTNVNANTAAGEAPPPKIFGKPEQLVDTLSKTFHAGNVVAALEIAGRGTLDKPTADRLETLVTRGNYRIAESAPVEEIGRIDTKIRYAFDFERPAADGLAADRKRILVDIDRSDPAAGWLVTGVHIPTFSAIAPAAATTADPGAPAGAAPAPGASRAVVVVEGDAAGPKDPLMLAHEFVEAVLNQDFAKAKSLVADGTITEEKLAGLIIVAEEGGFERKTGSPLVATATRDDAAWVIAQMKNAQTGADFGLEIVKAGDGSGDWKIAGLNLDSLLLARSKMADAGDITYTPIIDNPKGGESLVLYFGYDESGLHPRAVRQIEIVAGILKSDPEKTILIGGHADARGPEDYNEQLSKQRAVSVRRGLLDAGVNPAQILTRSFGESEPISPNLQPDGTDNPTGRKRNRRAEVYLNF